MFRGALFLSCVVLLSLPLVSHADYIRICDDENEWPPYTFYKRVDGKVDKEQLEGAVVQLLTAVFKEVGIRHEIRMVPWQRCLKEVKHFDQNRQFGAFVNGSYSDQRNQDYLLSDPLYQTHQGAFYASDKFTNGPPISRAYDINNFKLCGVKGYNLDYLYSEFGLLSNKRIDDEAKDIETVLQKVSLGRCDLFINSIEPVYGAAHVGKLKIPDNVEHILIPGASPTNFHLGIFKGFEEAKALSGKINDALHKLESSGEKEKIFKRYLPSQ